MIVSDMGQARVFLINILFGMLCVAIYDLFYIVANRCIKGRLWTNLTDAIYLFVTFCALLYAGIKFNLGALRYYQIFGLLAGIFIQSSVFSKVERKLFDFLFKAAGKGMLFIVRCVWFPVSFVLRGIFTFTEFLEDKAVYVGHKINKKVKKVKIKNTKKKKTVKKRFKMI